MGQIRVGTAGWTDYNDEELAMWAGNIQRLAEDAAETQVVFNNCYRDYAQVNARQLTEKLTQALTGQGRRSGNAGRGRRNAAAARPPIPPSMIAISVIRSP